MARMVYQVFAESPRLTVATGKFWLTPWTPKVICCTVGVPTHTLRVSGVVPQVVVTEAVTVAEPLYPFCRVAWPVAELTAKPVVFEDHETVEPPGNVGVTEKEALLQTRLGPVTE